MINATIAYVEASADSAALAALAVGDELRILDCSRGWSWGYLPDGRVAYIASEAVSA